MVALTNTATVREKAGAVPVGARSEAQSINIAARTWLRTTLLIVCALLLAHSLTQVIRFTSGHDHLLGLTPLFYMYAEQNVPTWFSSVILLTCSGLLAVIANAKMRSGDRFRFHWLSLCLLFLLLSLDETATVHEKLGAAFGRILPYSILSAWIIPYVLAGGCIAALFVRFFFALPGRYQALFCLSGLVYVGGAVGLEVFEVFHVLAGGANDPVFVLQVTIEEVMEQMGAALFAFSLLRYIREYFGEIRINFT